MEIPGYREAVVEETEARDYAFLGLPREICGLRVNQMTLRQFLVRVMIDCPFICRTREAEREDAIEFLWFLSPEFKAAPEGTRRETAGYLWWKKELLSLRDKFVRGIINIPHHELVAGIDDYLAWTFMDAPGATENRPYISYTSFVATYIDILMSEYGSMNADDVLDTALVQMYQLIRERLKRLNPKAILFNSRSDKVRGDFYAKRERGVQNGESVNGS